MEQNSSLVPERIPQRIHFVRGHKVMLDADLASLYGVETRVLVQAVKRNSQRFPPDFMFQLADEERAALRSQFVTSKGRDQAIAWLIDAIRQLMTPPEQSKRPIGFIAADAMSGKTKK